jgi:hypothetical protein
MTIVDTSTAASPGFATMRPAGSTVLTALVNWTVSSPGFQLGNAAVITQAQNAAFGNAEELEILTSGAVHAIVDLGGAFLAPTATALQCVTTANIATPVNAGVNFSLNASACPATYTSVSVNCRTSGFNTVNYASIGANTGGADCQGTNTSGAQITMNVSQTCCRVPGR